MHTLLALSLLALAEPDHFWGVGLDKDFTVHDALQVQCSLFYKTAQAPAPDPKLCPTLTLATEGKPPVEKTLDERIAVYAYRDPAPKRDAIAWSTSFDLRTAFGRLPAGKYVFRIRMPGIAESPECAFEIVQAKLEDARKTPPEGDAALELRVEETPKEGLWIGVLTNRGRTALEFHGYVQGESVPDPVEVIARSERWHPVRGWRGSAIGFCGTGLREIALKPGESRRVALTPAADGIVRWTVDCRPLAQPTEQPLFAVSGAVLIATMGG